MLNPSVCNDSVDTSMDSSFDLLESSTGNYHTIIYIWIICFTQILIVKIATNKWLSARHNNISSDT